MKTVFLKSGNVFRVSSEGALDLHKQLPAGNYVVVKNPITQELELEQTSNFELKLKLYGNVIKYGDRILKTFTDRTSSTGVVLNGEKGSGKTLICKYVCINAAKSDVPTILVNAPWKGDAFNILIQSIQQPCIIFFDEFEKIYDHDDQKYILTLMDGVFTSKKLFLLTCNDESGVNYYLRNRPGRVYYMFDFRGLDQEFIREYCEDNLENWDKFNNTKKEYINKICKISSLFDHFNFDILKALIEDMNRFKESPQEVLQFLNAKPEHQHKSSYNVELYIDNRLIKSNKIDPEIYDGSPIPNWPIEIEYNLNEEENSEKDNWKTAIFKNIELIELEHTKGKFTFINNKGYKLILTKIQENKSFAHRYMDAL